MPAAGRGSAGRPGRTRSGTPARPTAGAGGGAARASVGAAVPAGAARADRRRTSAAGSARCARIASNARCRIERSSSPTSARSRCSRHSRRRRSRAKHPRAVAEPGRVARLALVRRRVEHGAGQFAVVRPRSAVEVVRADHGPDVVDDDHLRVHVDRRARRVLDVVDGETLAACRAADLDGLLAADQARPAARRPPCRGIGARWRSRAGPGSRCSARPSNFGDERRPQVLVLDVDEPARAGEGLPVGMGDAAFAERRERVAAQPRRVGPQHLHRVGPARRRVRQRLRKVATRSACRRDRPGRSASGSGWTGPARCCRTTARGKVCSRSATPGPRTAAWTSCQAGARRRPTGKSIACGSPACAVSSCRLRPRSMPPKNAMSWSGRPGHRMTTNF